MQLKKLHKKSSLEKKNEKLREFPLLFLFFTLLIALVVDEIQPLKAYLF